MTEPLEEPTHCKKCRQAFDPTGTQWGGNARYRQTTWCRGCVDWCIDTEIADHQCAVCR